MEVEQVRSTQSNIVTQQQQMTQTLLAITNSVNSTVGSAWIGQSSSEFQQQYDQLRSSITQQLDQLEQLAQRLSSEIAEWEQMASRLA
jgi:uncharacterized protein YukE